MMLRRFVLISVFLMSVALFGCSDGRTGAPLDFQAHPATWIATHPGAALAVAGFADCVSCHGNDLTGQGAAVSCFSCHSYNVAPPFIVHPADWTDPYVNHRGFAATNGFTSCANCHGADLLGSVAAPSCFSASFSGLNCHADGPGQAPHPLDGTYLNGAIHGPEAEADLTSCQNCHGESGAPGSNPRFNVGITSVSGTGCENAICHPVGYAHPSNWGADPSATFHNGAGNIANACTLCHGVALDGGGTAVGGSCFACHGTSPADNPANCLSCHGQPPNGVAPVGNISPNRLGQHNRAGHFFFLGEDPVLSCVRCHDGAGSGTAIHFDGTNPADVIFQNPDVSDTMSAVSDAVNTTCNGNCHSTFNGADINFNHVNQVWY